MRSGKEDESRLRRDATSLSSRGLEETVSAGDDLAGEVRELELRVLNRETRPSTWFWMPRRGGFERKGEERRLPAESFESTSIRRAPSLLSLYPLQPPKRRTFLSSSFFLKSTALYSST